MNGQKVRGEGHKVKLTAVSGQCCQAS